LAAALAGGGGRHLRRLGLRCNGVTAGGATAIAASLSTPAAGVAPPSVVAMLPGLKLDLSRNASRTRGRWRS
jgi:hypothetical protein